MHDLLNLFVVIITFGMVLWLINRLVPMAGAIKGILNVLVVIVIVIYILEFFTLIPDFLPVPEIFRHL